MYRIVYMSRASRDMTPADLDVILEAARKNNSAVDVTGMLLFAENTFFQVLEGPKFAVEQIYERVDGDDRHCRVKVMSSRDVNERRFLDWTMGYSKLSEADEDASAFFDLSKAALEDRIPETAGDDLLKLLYGFASAKLAA